MQIPDIDPSQGRQRRNINQPYGLRSGAHCKLSRSRVVVSGPKINTLIQLFDSLSTSHLRRHPVPDLNYQTHTMPASNQVEYSSRDSMEPKLSMTDEFRSHSSLPPADSFEINDDVNEQRQGLLSGDLEKQSEVEEVLPQSVTQGAEYAVSTRTKLSFLGFYFALNLVSIVHERARYEVFLRCSLQGLTLYNKAVLGKV